ncbi:MAG: hypothetical protein Q9190_000861 [Brigantiaea leucoxantha]
MALSPPTRFTVALLPPPGSSVFKARYPIPQNPDDAIPPLFLSALSVRGAVFQDEQKCSPEKEIEEDDTRSWHWVYFDNAPATPFSGEASAPVSAFSSAKCSSSDSTPKPAATVRLVPVPLDKTEGTAVGREHSEKTGEERIAEDQGIKTEPYHGATEMWDGVEPYATIGRVATLEEYRGRGIAKRLIQGAFRWAEENKSEVTGGGEPWKGLVLIHAQKAVEGWYEKLGFVTDKGLGEWWEEGILHVGMWIRLNPGEAKN